MGAVTGRILASVAAVQHPYPPEPGEARLEDPIEEGAAALPDGRRLGYARFGDPAGDPIFYFHGMPGARRQIPVGAPEAARALGLQIIGVERPGVGYSTNHHYGQVRDFVPDFVALLDHLGIDKFIVSGLSGGGPFVLAVSHDLPDRTVAGFVFGGVGPLAGADMSPGALSLARILSPIVSRVRAPLGAAASLAIKPLLPHGRTVLDLYARYLGGADRPAFNQPGMKTTFLNDLVGAGQARLHGIANDMVMFTREWGFRLADIEVPIKMWWGTADHIVPVAHATHQASNIPNSTLRLRKGEGHFSGFMVHHEWLPAAREAFDNHAGV